MVERRIRNNITNADDRFGGYKPEIDSPVRKLKVEHGETLRELKTIFRKFLRKNIKGTQERGFLTAQDVAKEMIADISYTAKDVEKFSLVLAEFQHEKDFPERAGRFLSVLINKGKDSNYVLHTGHLEHISYIGVENIKNIVIEGDGGDEVAYGMESGKIVLKGDTGSAAGDFLSGGELIIKGNSGNGLGRSMSGGKIILHGNLNNPCIYVSAGDMMRGGEIIILGNVGDNLGHSTKGGKITVMGDAGDNVGTLMSGGEIHLNGEFGSLARENDNPNFAYQRNGLIYHKGVLILDRATLRGPRSY